MPFSATSDTRWASSSLSVASKSVVLRPTRPMSRSRFANASALRRDVDDDPGQGVLDRRDCHLPAFAALLGPVPDTAEP